MGPVETERAPAGIEDRLRHLPVGGDPLETARRLADVEVDLGRPEASGALLVRAGGWRDLARSVGATAAAGEADGLLRDVVRDEAERWRASAEAVAAGADPDACFDALRRATELDRDALGRLGDPDAPLLARDEGRATLRKAFADAIAREAPRPGQRERWTRDLLDRASSSLAAVDEIPQALAATSLGLVRDDLAWHLREVETARGPRRRRIGRKKRRVAAEAQERDLQARLEARFGRRATAIAEWVVLGLVFLVLGLLLVESIFTLPRPVLVGFVIADTVACAVFLVEFFTRLAIVRGKWMWFRRHVWFDLLPSIPFGLLVLGFGRADPTRAGRLVRLLRLPQAARYVRVLLPAIRLFRAFGFLTRGMDRLARRYGPLLDREVIVFATADERRPAPVPEEKPVQLAAVEADVDGRWRALLSSSPAESREEVARARLGALARLRAMPPRWPAPTWTPQGAVPAEVFLTGLASMTEEEIVATQPADLVRRLARAVRWFSRAPVRWFPVLRRYVPRLGPRMTDAGAVAAASRSVARELKRHHDRILWFADLYGTVTPAEFVDRLGTAMVRSSSGPAYRLTVFGGVFLFVQVLLVVSGLEIFERVAGFLGDILGVFLLVIGGVCFVVLGVGWWFKRIANEATAFFEQVAAAQFLPLTEAIKGRFIERDAEEIEDRVLGPERRVAGEDADAGREAAIRRWTSEVRAWLQEAHAPRSDGAAFNASDRTVLLYRDALDGGLFGDSDTRTTNQVLGNQALRHLRDRSRRIDRRERKAIRALDLERQRTLVRGPYPWFMFVTRAIAQSVARLVVDYNHNAIPLAELPRASQEERRRHAAWLEHRSDRDDEWARAAADAKDPRTATTAFSALHFIDDDPQRDKGVRERFGVAVVRRLAEDRRLLFRRIFGTYPLHEQPREQRVLNLHRAYEEWFSGGRALLMPFRLSLRSLKFVGGVIRWTGRAVREIWRPGLRADVLAAAKADFDTALRKIDRMRGPVLRSCLWLRARVDLEYLGILLPGTDRSGLEGREVDADLRWFGPDPVLARRVSEERRRAREDVARLLALRDAGLVDRLAARLEIDRAAFGREHLRAAILAYRGDLDSIRTLLSCHEILLETLSRAPREEMGGIRFPRPRLRWRFRRWWKLHGEGDRAVRKAVWRAVRHDEDGAGRALTAWAEHGPADARERGERALAEVLRHPHRVSEQLVTLRAVHVLAMIDLRTYREHVFRVGGYGAPSGGDRRP